jgi:hypothetical protein
MNRKLRAIVCQAAGGILSWLKVDYQTANEFFIYRLVSKLRMVLNGRRVSSAVGSSSSVLPPARDSGVDDKYKRGKLNASPLTLVILL